MYLLNRALLFISIITFWGCSNSQRTALVGDVSIMIDLSKDNLFTSALSITNTDHFKVRIENIYNKEEVISFNNVHDIPSRLFLKQGQYEITASLNDNNGDLSFLGKQLVTIIDGNSTLVHVKCNPMKNSSSITFSSTD